MTGFSVLVANGDAQNQSYTVSDNLGESTTFSLALSGSVVNGARTVVLSGSGITTVSTSANANFWNFAIDNVTFDAVPEPCSGFLALGGLGVAFWRSRKRSYLRLVARCADVNSLNLK